MGKNIYKHLKISLHITLKKKFKIQELATSVQNSYHYKFVFNTANSIKKFKIVVKRNFEHQKVYGLVQLILLDLTALSVFSEEKYLHNSIN